MYSSICCIVDHMCLLLFLFAVSSGISSSPLPPKPWPKHSFPIPQCSSWSKPSISGVCHFTYHFFHTLFSVIKLMPPTFWYCILSRKSGLTFLRGNDRLPDFIDWSWSCQPLNNYEKFQSQACIVISNRHRVSVFVSPTFAAVYKRMLLEMKVWFFLLKPWRPTRLCAHYGWRQNCW